MSFIKLGKQKHLLKTFESRPLAALLAFAIICSPACGSLVDRKQRMASNHGMRLSSMLTAVDERSDTYATTDASYVVIESNGNTFITPIIVPAANDSAALDLSHPQIAASEPGTEINVIPEDGGCIDGSGCYAPLPDLNSSPTAQPATATSTNSASVSPTPEYSDRGSGGSNLPPFEPSQPWPAPSVGNENQPANQAPSPNPAPNPEVTSPQVATNIDPPVAYVPNLPNPSITQPYPTNSATIDAAASRAVTAALATLSAMQQQISNKLAKLVADSSSLLSDGRAARQKQPLANPATLAPKDYPFKTPLDSPDGQRLAEGFIYKKYVERNISTSDAQAKEKRKLVKAADAGLQQADSAFIRGANSEAEFLLNASTIALDIAISVGPLGWAKFGYEAFTKKDFLTGHPLNSVSHGIAIAAFTVSIIAMAATAEIGLPVLAGAAGVELVADMLKASTELDAGAGATAEVAEISEAIKGAEGILDSARNARAVKIPYGAGEAVQEMTGEALKVRVNVSSGAPLYRIGTRGKSQTGAQAQFWSPENPLSPGYAARHGIPPENLKNINFLETATLREGANYITRTAPSYGSNPGGAIEVVVPEGGVIIKSHSSL